MQISIYSLKKILYDGEAKLINCRTSLGEITILNNHIPLISDLIEGAIRIIDLNDKEYYFNIASGFLEVNSLNQVKILVDDL